MNASLQISRNGRDQRRTVVLYLSAPRYCKSGIVESYSWCNWLGSSRNISVQSRNNFSRERKQALLGGLRGFAGKQRRDQAHQRTVTTVEPDGVGDQIELRPVFTGQGSVVRPIPVEHEFALIALCDHVAIRFKRRASGKR